LKGSDEKSKTPDNGKYVKKINRMAVLNLVKGRGITPVII
jgi:hypothetical protein